MDYATGVDGCSAGWLAVRFDRSGRFDVDVFSTIQDLVDADPSAEVVLIDIPIGLVTRGPKGRQCDAEARRLLGGKRAPSVFTPPCRPATLVAKYLGASDLNQELTGRRLSKQSWSIVPKIAEVDALLERCRDLRSRILEVHPEVLFARLNGGTPMIHRKSSRDGATERLEVLKRFADSAPSTYDRALRRWPRSQVAKDDILDAMAAAITGLLGAGAFSTIPPIPELDDRGLPMQMVYWDPPASETTIPEFKLRCEATDLVRYATRYDAASDRAVARFLDAPEPPDSLNLKDLLDTVAWKSPRPLPRARENADEYVRAVTSASLASSNEQFRIESLRLLRGVGWPTASVILHLCLREHYPILDFRALWTSGVDNPPDYDFEFWWRFVEFFREQLGATGLSPRELDRALWQYSKEHQGEQAS